MGLVKGSLINYSLECIEYVLLCWLQPYAVGMLYESMVHFVVILRMSYHPLMRCQLMYTRSSIVKHRQNENHREASHHKHEG